nr:putative ribonuclease H-like domain-containing protein [Tanacetum cinerariifolium]
MQRKKNDVKARITLLLSLPDEHPFMDVEVEKDDLNQKFLTSLAPEWMIHTIVWRNRNDLDTMSLDDLYNHLKVYEAEVQKKSNLNSQDMAFISSSKNNSNEDGNIACVTTASTAFPTGSVNIATISQDTASAYIPSQFNGSQIKFEDINQIDEDDIEEMDIKWSMALYIANEEDHALVADGEAPTKSALMANTESKTEYKEREVKYIEKIRTLEMYRASNLKCIKTLEKELEELTLKKDGLDGKLAGLLKASKNLDHLIESQRSDQVKEGLGYNVVPPPAADLYLSPKKDLSWTNSECIVSGRNFKLLDDANILLRTPRQHNVYSIDLNNIVPHKDLTCLVAKASADECILWHRRLGHLNVKTMNKLVRHNLVRGLPTKSFDNDHTCTACLKGKQHKASCKSKLVNFVTKPLLTLHMDLFGLTSVSSISHKWYCLVVTDDFSRFTWTFFFWTKDETSGILKKFITEIENLKD